MEEKTNNLGTFRTLFLIYGILLILGSLFFLLYAGFGFYFSAMSEMNNSEMPFDPSSIFVVIGVVGFFIAIIFGILAILASKFIKKRIKYQFVFIASILMCLTGLLGILLGVFALIELSKAEVKELFSKS